MKLNNINLEELYEDINLARNSHDYLTLSEQDKAKFDQLASEAFNKVRGHQRDYSALKTKQRHLEQERTQADAAALKSSVGEELRGMYDKGEMGTAEYAATRAIGSMAQPVRGAIDLMTVPVDLAGIGARWLSGDRVGRGANELAENIRGVASEYIPDTFEGADSTLGGISGQVAGGIGRFAPSMALLGGAGALGKVAAKKAVRVGVPKAVARAIPFVTKTGAFTSLKIPELVKGREARTGEFKPGTDAAIGAVQSALFVATMGLFMNQGHSKIAALKLADTLQKTEGLGKIAAMSKHALEQGIRTGVAFGASGSAGELLRQYGQDDAIDLIQAFNTGASSAGMGFAFGIAGGIRSAYSIGKSVNDYAKRLAEEAKARLNDPAYKQAREFAFDKDAADHISKHLNGLKGDAGLAEILAALKKAEQTAPNEYVKMNVRWFAQDVKTKHDDGFFHKFESGSQKMGKDQTTPPGGTSKAGLPKEALVRRTAQPEGQPQLDYQWLERVYKGKPVDDTTAELPALKSSGYLQEPQAKLTSQNVLPSAFDSSLLLSEPQKKLADARPKVRVQKDLTPDPDAKVSIVKHRPVAEKKTTKLRAGDASRIEKRLPQPAGQAGRGAFEKASAYEAPDGAEIFPIHDHYYKDVLLEVKNEMKRLGAPTIRVIDMGNNEYAAVEGTHRLRAAKELGLTPKIIELDYDAIKNLDVMDPALKMDMDNPGMTIAQLMEDYARRKSFVFDKFDVMKEAEAFSKEAGINPPSNEVEASEMLGENWTSDIVGEARAGGYDGLIIKGTPDSGSEFQTVSNHYVVFKPEQVWKTDFPQQAAPKQKSLSPQASTENISTKSEKVKSANTGNKAIAHAPSGKSLNVKYAAIPADSLITSDMPEFPKELQPRDRDSAESQRQISSIAANPIIEKLITDYPDADTGSPIVVQYGGMNVVLSGNGRTIGMKRGYAYGTMVEYQKKLQKTSADFGLSEVSASNPVFVRVLQGNYTKDQLKALAVDLNRESKLAMTATETAGSDADAVNRFAHLVQSYDVYAASNREFIKSFLGAVTNKNDAGRYVNKEGQLSKDGKARIERALFSAAYGDGNLSAKFAEDPDPNIGNIINGMLNAAPGIAVTNSKVADNAMHDLSIGHAVAEAAQLLSSIRSQGQSVNGYFMQGQLFDDGVSLLAKDLLKLFDKYKRSGKKVTELLTGYNDAHIKLGDPRQTTFDVQTIPTRSEILKIIAERMEQRYEARQPDLFSMSPARIRETEKVPVSGQGITGRPDGRPDGRSTKQGSTQKPNQQIEDFGEKIGGAKKDLAKSWQKELTQDDIRKLPLSKIWPKHELDEIEDNYLAAFATAARAEIPAKPRVKYKVSLWVEKVQALRGVTDLVAKHPEKVNSEDFPELHDFFLKVDVLARLPRSEWDRIGKVYDRQGAYSYGKDGEKIPAPSTIVEIDDRHARIESANLDEIVKAVEEKLATNSNKASDIKMKFEARGSKSSGYYINKKGDPLYRPLKLFNTAEEAIKFLRSEENRLELANAWEQLKERENVSESDVRKNENRIRLGEDYRKGKDITPEEFAKAFGFRGIEFGNWVTQGKGGKERQGMLNIAYDAFMDLAKLLNVQPEALSLNGSLGMAFGSRGSGKASAHYEPDKLVINLTKTKGAGSLAHEWFHALDNYFSRFRGVTKISAGFGAADSFRDENYITHKPEPLYVRKGSSRSGYMTKDRLESLWLKNGGTAKHRQTGEEYFDPKYWHPDPNHPQGVRPEVEKRFAELVKALNDSPMTSRALTMDKAQKGYWSQTLERAARAFENFVIDSLKEKGQHNDYLANVVSPDVFVRDTARYPYLLESELPPVKKAFDNLFKTIKSRKTDKGVELYSVEHLFAKYGAKAVKAGWSLFKKGAKKFAEWAREMSRKFGKAIHKHLKTLWTEIRQEYSLIKKGRQLRNSTVASVKRNVIRATERKRPIQVAKEWAQANDLNGVIKTEIGDVVINAKAISNSLSHTLYQNKLDAIPAIKPVLQKGTYLGSLRDLTGKPIDNHYFAGMVSFDGDKKIVFVRTRMAEGRRNRFYVHEVFTEEDILRRPETTLGKGSRMQTGTRQNYSDLYRNIIRPYLDVKPSEYTKRKRQALLEDGQFLITKSKAQGAADRLSALPQSSSTNNVTPSGQKVKLPKELADRYGKKVAKKALELFTSGMKEFAKWAKEMSKSLGKAVHKHLRNIWKDIHRVAKDRRGAVGDLKKTIRKKTGQRRLADEIKSVRPSEALKWRFQRGEVDARAAAKATEKLYQPTIKRLEAEARRTGKKIDRVKQLDDNQKIVRTLIQAILPTDKRAFLLQQAANAKTIKRLQAIAEKAVNASEDYYHERELSRFKDLVKRTEKLHSMLAPDRQKLLEGLQIDEGRQALKSVRHFLNDFEKQDADFDAPSWLKKDLEDAIRTKDTRDLTPMEMEVINDSLEFLVQAQAMIKKAYIGGQWKEVDEVAVGIADTLSRTKFDPGLLKRTGNKLADKYGEIVHGVAPVKRTPEYGLLGHLKSAGPMNTDGHDFARQFGSEGKKVFYDNLVEGDTVQNTVLRNTEGFLQDTVASLGLGAEDTKTFGNWINKPVMKVLDRFGRSLDVTRGEKLDIVALSEFRRARRQLADSGIVLTRDRSTNVIDVSEDWLDRLAAELSPKERQLKDALVMYINEDILSAVNEVHQNIKAFPLVAPGSKDKYFPTSRDRAHGHRAPSDDILDDQAERLVTPSGFSFLKETRDNKYPFRIDNILSKFKDHTRKAAVYIGHAQNVRTLEMVRNYPGMESKIIRALGKESWNRLKLLTEAVSQAGNTPGTETMSHWLKLYRKIVPALLTPRSMFVQYASLGNVPAMVPAKHLVWAMINPKNHTPAAVIKLMNDDADMWRRLSNYKGNIMFTGNLELDATPALLKPFTHFDGVTMVIIHEAVKAWAKETGRPQSWAKRKANEVVSLTQNTGTTPDATGTQLAMKGGKDIVSILAGTYVSQRAKTRNLLSRIWRDKAKSKVRKATDMAVLLLTGLAFNVVADQLFSRLRGRQPDIMSSATSEIFDVFVTGPHARLAGVSAYNARRMKEGRRIHGSSGFVIDQVYDLTNAFGLLIKQVYEGDASAASNIAQAIRIGAAAGVFAGIPQAFITWPIETIDAHILSESGSEEKSESNTKGKRLPDGRMTAPTKARPRTPRRPRRPKR